MHQRTYCPKFAVYLQEQLREQLRRVPYPPGGSWPRIDVDVEYNRALEETKKLPIAETRPHFCRFNDGLHVFPDLIIHRRRHSTANLCAIEVRDTQEENEPGEGNVKRDKENNKDTLPKDFWKLIGFLEFLDYEYSLFIRLVVKSRQPNVSEAWLLEGKVYKRIHNEQKRLKNLDELESLVNNNPPSLLADRIAGMWRICKEVGFRDVTAELRCAIPGCRETA